MEVEVVTIGAKNADVVVLEALVNQINVLELELQMSDDAHAKAEKQCEDLKRNNQMLRDYLEVNKTKLDEANNKAQYYDNLMKDTVGEDETDRLLLTKNSDLIEENGRLRHDLIKAETSSCKCGPKSIVERENNEDWTARPDNLITEQDFDGSDDESDIIYP